MEDVEDLQWQLNKKIYFPDAQDQHEEYEEARARGYSMVNLTEQVHTWRLICIAYFLLHGRHMVVDQSLKEQKEKGMAPKLSLERVEKKRKELWYGLHEGKVRLESLLQGGTSQAGGLNFQLREVEKFYNINVEEDSLVQRMHFDKVKFELRTRELFFSEILSLMTTERFFKRFINAKKYIILFSGCALEEAYQGIMLVWKERQNAGMRHKIANELKEPFKNMSFRANRDKRKDYITTTTRKIEEYSRRGETDAQGVFLLRTRPEYVNIITETRTELNKFYGRENILLRLEGTTGEVGEGDQ